jgi:hypothetical protein
MYTSQDIIDELKATCKKTRKRQYLDKRNYLIGILYNKYNMTEEHMASLCNINRCTIHASKNQALELIKQKNTGFLTNIEEYTERFPYSFVDLIKTKRSTRNHSLVLTLSDDIYKKLKSYTLVKEYNTINIAARELLTKNIKLWEE